MKLVGLCLARNEDYILGFTARVALNWCDSLIILNHGSTDGTADIIEEIQAQSSGRVSVLSEPAGETWDEMTHRQELLTWGRQIGGTHFAIIDADEALTANLWFDVRRHIETLPARGMLELPGYNLRKGITSYHENGVWSDRWFSTAFKDDPRASWDGNKFHQRAPENVRWFPVRPVPQGQGGILHFWGASERRLHEKHRLYRVTERVRFLDKPVADIERMYSLAEKGDPKTPRYGTPETWTYSKTPAAWWPGALTDYINLDRDPWQKAEADRLIEQYGREHFNGLSV
jgi:Glycosyl transferase family 2